MQAYFFFAGCGGLYAFDGVGELVERDSIQLIERGAIVAFGDAAVFCLLDLDVVGLLAAAPGDGDVDVRRFVNPLVTNFVAARSRRAETRDSAEAVSIVWPLEVQVVPACVRVRDVEPEWYVDLVRIGIAEAEELLVAIVVEGAIEGFSERGAVVGGDFVDAGQSTLDLA